MTPCVVKIEEDGTLLVDAEGLLAEDANKKTWESRKCRMAGKEGIAFFPKQ